MDPVLPTTYREWRQVAFQLSADLQHLHTVAERWGLSAAAAQARALRARAEDRRFVVAVVGDFKRGKSTFINALLGREVLPADILPTTATVNRVTYGIRPGVELRFHDGRPPQTIALDALAEHVTKQSEASREAAAAIKEAVVSFPVRFCKNDVDLVDTPGLGDEATMTAVTMAVLPEVDAAIFVVMADSPFSGTEGEFLDRLLAAGMTRVIFVVSAIDRIRRPADRERVVESIRSRVRERIHAAAGARFTLGSPDHLAFLALHGEPRVYGLSALEAMEARLEEDAARLEASGMPAFESTLEAFLTASDGLGLLRRLEQCETLGKELGRALHTRGGGDTPRGVATALELPRLEALLEGLETALEGQRRATLDAATRTLVGLEETLARWPVGARTRIGQRIARSTLPQAWKLEYFDFSEALGVGIVETARELVDELATAIDARLATAPGAPTGEGRVSAAVSVVLAHVSTTLEALGGPPVGGSGAAPAHDAAPAEARRIDRSALAASLIPAALAFTDTVRTPDLLAALDRYGQRSGLDRIIAFDFGGLQSQWAALAMRQVDALCAVVWSPDAVAWAVRARVEALAQRELTRLEPAAQAVRRARQDLLGFRARAAVLAEQDTQDRSREMATIEHLRANTARVREALGTHLRE